MPIILTCYDRCVEHNLVIIVYVCFSFYSASNRRIRAGTTYRNTGGVLAYVQKENNHPNYGQYGFDADITVVELITPLIYTPVVQQGTIMAQGAVIPDESPVVHAGWGATSVSNLLLLNTCFREDKQKLRISFSNSKVGLHRLCFSTSLSTLLITSFVGNAMRRVTRPSRRT